MKFQKSWPIRPKASPLTTRGAGTGFRVEQLCRFGGVVLSMERFNKILFIDEKNLQATVEPGVITQVFQEEVAKKGLFYPPDPSSRGSYSLAAMWRMIPVNKAVNIVLPAIMY